MRTLRSVDILLTDELLQYAGLIEGVSKNKFGHGTPHMKPLDPPNTIEGDANATEMLRLWAAHGELKVAINIGSYHEQGHDEAKAWGIIAADFAKHVALALQQRYGESQSRTIEEFRRSFLAEIEDSTSDITGE